MNYEHELTNNSDQISPEIYNLIERDLNLTGCVALEDRL